MADFDYVPCPQCKGKFMLGTEFFRIPTAYAHCPYCGTEFKVGAAKAAEEGGQKQPNPR